MLPWRRTDERASEYIYTGCLRKNALLGFLNPWDRLMPVVTIVLVKVVGGMLDDD